MGRQPRGGPAAAFGPNGLAPASPAEGREAGRQRTHAMHDYRGLPTEERRETPGRKKWRWRRIVHSARSLPCAGKRSVAGRSPARVPSCAPLQRVRMFHVKHSGRPGCAPPHEPGDAGELNGEADPGSGLERRSRGIERKTRTQRNWTRAWGAGGAGGRGERRVREREEAGAGARERDRTRRARARAREAERRNSG